MAFSGGQIRISGGILFDYTIDNDRLNYRRIKYY